MLILEKGKSRVDKVYNIDYFDKKGTFIKSEWFNIKEDLFQEIVSLGKQSRFRKKGKSHINISKWSPSYFEGEDNIEDLVDKEFDYDIYFKHDNFGEGEEIEIESSEVEERDYDFNLGDLGRKITNDIRNSNLDSRVVDIWRVTHYYCNVEKEGESGEYHPSNLEDFVSEEEGREYWDSLGKGVEEKDWVYYKEGHGYSILQMLEVTLYVEDSVDINSKEFVLESHEYDIKDTLYEEDKLFNKGENDC